MTRLDNLRDEVSSSSVILLSFLFSLSVPEPINYLSLSLSFALDPFSPSFSHPPPTTTRSPCAGERRKKGRRGQSAFETARRPIRDRLSRFSRSANDRSAFLPPPRRHSSPPPLLAPQQSFNSRVAVSPRIITPPPSPSLIPIRDTDRSYVARWWR